MIVIEAEYVPPSGQQTFRCLAARLDIHMSTGNSKSFAEVLINDGTLIFDDFVGSVLFVYDDLQFHVSAILL